MAIGAALAFIGSAPRTAVAQAPAERCYTTGGGHLQVCRSVIEPEGVFFSPPKCELAYNVQPMRLPDGRTYTIYHSEPQKVEATCEATKPEDRPQVGDSLRGGFQPNAMDLALFPNSSPEHKYVLWGSTTDIPSTLYSAPKGAGVSYLSQTGGPGNPMLVAGRHAAGDNYYYLHFLMTVKTPTGNNPTQVRHFLGIARSLDLVDWDLRTHVDGVPTWVRFDAKTSETSRRANEVADSQGQLIQGRCASTTGDSQGLIGSISYVGDRYYYVYTDISANADCAADKPEMTLYVREALDITQVGSWGPAQIIKTGLPHGTIVRAAKAKDLDKWAISYNCYSDTGAAQATVQDLCLQYSDTLAMQGAQGVAGLTFYDDPPSSQYPRSQYYLGIRIGSTPTGDRARQQHYWLTDRDGNLVAPSAYPSQGGVLTFADGPARPTTPDRSIGAPYGVPVYWATWQVRVVN
jgi:hypothetical protein